MKREVRVKIEFILALDDEGEGIPFITSDKINGMIVDGLATVVPAGDIHGAKLSMSLTRESSNAMRAKYRKPKAVKKKTA